MPTSQMGDPLGLFGVDRAAVSVIQVMQSGVHKLLKLQGIMRPLAGRAISGPICEPRSDETGRPAGGAA